MRLLKGHVPLTQTHTSAHDLLQASALIWAQRYAIQPSKSLSWNHFHLAHRMPSYTREARPGTRRSDLIRVAIHDRGERCCLERNQCKWQRVTILRNWFMGLHPRAFSGLGRERACPFQYRRRKIGRYLPHLRACKGSKPVKCFTVSSYRGIYDPEVGGPQLEPWPSRGLSSGPWLLPRLR